MSRLAVVALALCACGDRTTESAPVTPQHAPGDAGVDAGAPKPVLTAPHSKEIAVVAVGDRGDVAFTADDNGELRFWPALDGSREPVALGIQSPTDLAIAREHDGYVAALIDTADGITLLRFTADGGLRSREVLPAEPGHEELIAGEGFVLARRNDHTIVRIDANVKPSPPLAPELGEQVLAVAARRKLAIAGIADRERASEIRYIRTIKLDGGLGWGKQVELPVPLAAPIALSPSGNRVAGLHARTGAGVIVELVPKPHVITNDVVGTDPAENVIGFLDEGHAVFRGGVMIELDTPAATRDAVDPWASVRTKSRARLGRGPVVADRAVYGGASTHLVIADGSRAQFLGYRDLGLGFLRVTGAQITLVIGNRVLWLDDKLRLRHVHEVANDAAIGLAVDDTHLIKATYSYLENQRSKLDVSLLDAPTGQEFSLAGYPLGATVTYDPQTSVLAVSGYTSTVARGFYDRVTNRVTALRELKVRADSDGNPLPNTAIDLLDPKLAGGAVAVTQAFSGSRYYIDTYVDDGKSQRPLKPATTVKLSESVTPIGVSETGAVFTLASPPDSEPKPIVVHQGGKEVKRILVDGTAVAGAIDRTGSQIAAYSNAHLALYGSDGKERWRAPLWSINMARFTTDGKTLIVNTQGGLVAFDAETGARRATGCGWGFGMSNVEPPLTVFLAPVVCGESK